MAGRTGMRWGVRSYARCHPHRLDMGHGLCKSCYQKQRYKEDGGRAKEQMMAYAKAHPRMRAVIWRKHAYGLSELEWHRLYRAQRGRCAICGKPEPINVLNVDHDHCTDRVRGLLCGSCNKALGLLRDDPALLLRAVQYLGAVMARKQDPIFSVMDFFETEPLAVVRSAFSLVKRVVHKRQLAEQPPVEKKAQQRRRMTAATPAPANTATPITGDAPSAPPPATVTRPVPPRRRAGAVAETAAATNARMDAPGPRVPLPGLGPSTIGE